MVATLYTVYLKNIRQHGLLKYDTFTHHSLPASYLNRLSEKKEGGKVTLTVYYDTALA
ncbi:hypothetical protein WN51_04946 [Melipona quadrifasciata]|uniref:Uncharacterized protein n=1 Tax=Melipona quadrifasciata TaxID=166423 RepID=A0A0N0BD66_9HYME|nr:hypothetical protein WN51_04946 [Melipona quadrifasciata]